MPTRLEAVQVGNDMPNVVSVDTGAFRRASVVNPEFSHLVDDAAKATEAEHNMTLLEGLRTYPKALGWSVLISSAVVMEGFDTILMGIPINVV